MLFWRRRTARNRSKVHAARRLFFLIRPIKLLIWGHCVVVPVADATKLLNEQASSKSWEHMIGWMRKKWCGLYSRFFYVKRKKPNDNVKFPHPSLTLNYAKSDDTMRPQKTRFPAPTKDMILTVLRSFPKNGGVNSIKRVFRWIDTLPARSRLCIALILLKIILTYVLTMTQRSKVRHTGTGLWFVQSLPEEQAKKNLLYQ